MSPAVSCGSRASQYVKRPASALAVLGLLFCLVASGKCGAQELEPRAYSPSPIGANFAVLSSSRSTGDVVGDPSIPVSNIEARLNTVVAAYGRTFDFFGRSASAGLATPYVFGTISGSVGEQSLGVSRSGLADTQLRFAVNLLGGPALTPAQFAVRAPEPTLGTSLIVTAPTGQYDSGKLINLGTNRWGFKPEIGFSYPNGYWFFETYVGVWLYTENPAFYGGTRRQQAPLVTLQGHVSYTIRPRMWVALDATYYNGGRTTQDGIPQDNIQANSRVGLTFSLPLGARQSLKFAASDGATIRVGGDFVTYGIAWQYFWFD
jgi:hypothetical protein